MSNETFVSMDNSTKGSLETGLNAQSFYRSHGKRMLDIVLSAIGLVVLSPVLLLVAVCILLEDKSPVLFRQVRCGRFGHPFTIYKFRSMRFSSNPGFQPGNKSRITRIGHILRKTKIDELPQLWNVFQGDMSLVGPRPEVEAWVRPYTSSWAKAHLVRPGITDWASIELRNEEEKLAGASDPDNYYLHELLPTKWSLYDKYVEEYCLWVDLKILVRTIKVVVSR